MNSQVSHNLVSSEFRIKRKKSFSIHYNITWTTWENYMMEIFVGL